MKKTKLLAMLITLLFFANCSVTKSVKAKNVTVAPGTVVPFAKISNEAFAENYIGADVIVDCVFLSSQSTASYTNKRPPKNHFAFQVVGDDVNPTKNELTEALEGMVVYAPLHYSDLVFGLKKGDKLTLRGGTLVTKLTMGAISGINTRYVHLKATSIIERE